MPSGAKVSDILKKNSDRLMAIAGVVGTGEGTLNGKACVIVFVEKKSALLRKKIPKTLDEYPVVIKEIGKVRALPSKK